MFRQQPIRQQQTVGEQIRAARHAQDLKLSDLSAKLRIPERYLDALERGAYNELPSPVYVKNYLRLFLKELQIPWERIEEKIEKEISVFHGSSDALQAEEKKRQRSGAKSTAVGAHQKKPLIIPRIVKIGFFGIIVLLIVTYFVWEIVKLLSPPELVVTYPENDIIVTEQMIMLTGQTEPEAEVKINTQQVQVNPDGGFEEEITLHEGLNTIYITTRSKRSSEREIIRHILYKSGDN